MALVSRRTTTSIRYSCGLRNIPDGRGGKVEGVFKAIQLDRPELVQQLLQEGADPNQQTKSGQTPLIWAAMTKRLGIVKILISFGADVNAHGKNKRTALHDACQNIFSQADRELAQQIVLELLKAGANINVLDRNGETPLVLSAMGGELDLVKLLISHGASVNTKDRQGRTALHRAVRHNFIDVVRVLLENGAEVDPQTNNYRQTPLIYAGRGMGGRGDIIQLLLSYGADKDLKDYAGWSALDRAKSPRKWDECEVIQFFEEPAD
jgi:ankyrin repeat protein